jgi:hypothetical protein
MGIKVNMSDKEASSAPREPLPNGKYLVCWSDGSLAFSKSEKNNGKPYYSAELTVQDGKYEGRKIFTNVMCFEGALYSMSQIIKALGYAIGSDGSFMIDGHDANEIPELDWFIGRSFVVSVKTTPERTDKVTGKTYAARNEVGSWFPASDWAGAPAEATKASGHKAVAPNGAPLPS